jgi:hypothetical protein
MSYLESGKRRFRWISTLVHTSLRPEEGCVQCGSRLEANAVTAPDFTGKCLNCSSWVSDEEDGFEDFEE